MLTRQPSLSSPESMQPTPPQRRVRISLLFEQAWLERTLVLAFVCSEIRSELDPLRRVLLLANRPSRSCSANIQQVSIAPYT